MDASSPHWASLQSDLLYRIAKCLSTSVDVLRFRAVCHSWRSSIPSPPKIPSLKLHFPIGPRPYLNGYLLLIKSTVYAFQSLTNSDSSCDTARTLLIKIQESKSGKMILIDPLFASHSENLDTTEFPRVLNLLDDRVHEISKAYVLELVEQVKKGHELE
ncbi:F-box protein SKIP23-like [Hevea brasiliensis]|uniref:F-box protein SKIP23-like n=1 Tax=Hevea brasiliensis TaxID=3981 RepID=UPI0025F0C9F0|nr:F-box protein SKIP23-like [Hevea brasiliensis]